MKEPNSYVFTYEAQHKKPLDRVVVTKNVNKIMHQVSKQLNDKPNITRHTFRIYTVMERFQGY